MILNSKKIDVKTIMQERITSGNGGIADMQTENIKKRSNSFDTVASSRKNNMGAEKAFNAVLLIMGIIVILILAGILVSLFVESLPAIKYNGFGFLINNVWDPVTDRYGAVPFLLGTLLTSFLALVISIPFSLAVSIVLAEYLKEGWIPAILKSATDLLAGVPSVIYGFWGLFLITPIVRKIEMSLNLPPYGVSILAASIILAIMIIPYSASIAREVIPLVPVDIKEASYSLGATKYETIKTIILKYSMSGILAGIVLSLGRAIGETMAVTMLIGNSNILPKNFLSLIFNPGNTMASVIANEFTEATGNIYLSSLVEIGLLLFIVSFILNVIGKYIIRKFVIE